MKDDRAVIVCIPVDGSESKTIVDGSTKDVCRACKKEVWISPSSLKIKAEHNADVSCIPCAEIAIEEDDDPKFMQLTPEQKAEILGELLNKEDPHGTVRS